MTIIGYNDRAEFILLVHFAQDTTLNGFRIAADPLRHDKAKQVTASQLIFVCRSPL